MKAYLAIKFHADGSNLNLINAVSEPFHKAGIKTTCMFRDVENGGEIKFSPQELMQRTFNIMDESDILVIEFSEKGVGLGIEAGYAHAKGIPIFIIAKYGSDISETMQGIAKKVCVYQHTSDIEQFAIEISKTTNK